MRATSWFYGLFILACVPSSVAAPAGGVVLKGLRNPEKPNETMPLAETKLARQKGAKTEEQNNIVDPTKKSTSVDHNTPQTVPSDLAAHRKGFQLYGGLGVKTCLPDGAADCSNTYPGTFVVTGMEYRFWYLGLALDFDIGRFLVADDADFDISSLSLHFMPVVKGYYPLRTFDIFLGFGLGYGQQWVTEDSSRSEASWSTFWKAFKMTAGIGLDLKPYGGPEGMTLDLNLDLLLHSGGTRCAKYGGAGPCLDEKDLTGGQNDVSDQFRIGSALRYTF